MTATLNRVPVGSHIGFELAGSYFWGQVPDRDTHGVRVRCATGHTVWLSWAAMNRKSTDFRCEESE